ncbi:MAG: Gfo/Idh/MocA family oxidoreductase [Lachnospiraceae bacterium]|nr:Gfo/Idh/MocA family oxidoreductase [Lachnospiraceae bacterium]
MKDKIRYIVIGYGWRADFYIRAAQMLPDLLEVTARVVRTKERAEMLEGAVTDLEEALKTKPDFAVLCVPRGAVGGYLERLANLGVPVLCETPPAESTEGLNSLWRLAQQKKMKIQVAEQYILWPLYAGILRLVEERIIGEVQMMMLSAVHGYHAMNLFRKIMGIGFENCRIHGESFQTGFIKTEDRAGFDYSGQMLHTQRELASLEFENGKTAIYDFIGEQYNSVIRTRRLNIQGVRGEINDFTVRFLNGQNEGAEGTIRRIDRGVLGNSGWYHLGMQFGERFIYKNPFPDVRMNDDEIAVAQCLVEMKRYLETGEEFSSLRDALQDTYLSFVMEKCVQERITMTTENQEWA